MPVEQYEHRKTGEWKVSAPIGATGYPTSPSLFGSPDLPTLTNNNLAGHLRHLRRAPKRRAGPAWGVLADALCMSAESKRVRIRKRPQARATGCQQDDIPTRPHALSESGLA
eukprot:1663196-Pyramimonas_sp.AAC.1